MEGALTGLYEIDLLLFTACAAWQVILAGRRLSRWHYANIPLPPIPEWCKTLTRDYPYAAPELIKLRNAARRIYLVNFLESIGWPRLDYDMDASVDHPLGGIFLSITNSALRLRFVEGHRDEYCVCLTWVSGYIELGPTGFEVSDILLLNREFDVGHYVPLFATAAEFRSFCSDIIPKVVAAADRQEGNAIFRTAIPQKHWKQLKIAPRIDFVGYFRVLSERDNE